MAVLTVARQNEDVQATLISRAYIPRQAMGKTSLKRNRS
jgi:hypothetical protein